MIPLAGGEGYRAHCRGCFLVASAMEPGWQVPGISFRPPRRQIPGLATEPAGGEAQKLTETAQDVEDFAWSPDGRRLLLTLQDPTPEELEEAKGQR